MVIFTKSDWASCRKGLRWLLRNDWKSMFSRYILAIFHFSKERNCNMRFPHLLLRYLKTRLKHSWFIIIRKISCILFNCLANWHLCAQSWLVWKFTQSLINAIFLCRDLRPWLFGYYLKDRYTCFCWIIIIIVVIMILLYCATATTWNSDWSLCLNHRKSFQGIFKFKNRWWLSVWNFLSKRFNLFMRLRIPIRFLTI